MNEIRKTENAYMDLMSPVLDEISPYWIGYNKLDSFFKELLK